MEQGDVILKNHCNRIIKAHDCPKLEVSPDEISKKVIDTKLARIRFRDGLVVDCRLH